jgi:acyl-CoA thioesterase I
VSAILPPTLRRYVAWSLSIALLLVACTATGSTAPEAPASPLASHGVDASMGVGDDPPAYRQRLRLVALGDGYTAGTTTDAPNRDSWPAQLVQLINRSQMPFQFNGYNLAEPGDTSLNVLIDQLPQVESYQPDIVTLQVGANDIFTAHDFSASGADVYRTNLEAIFDAVLAILPADRILAVTTPDQELTLKGRAMGREGADSNDVALANAILHDVAGERRIVVVDIAPVYEMVVDDPGLVLDGGPYPSARQYAGWVEIIGQQIRRVLSTLEP